MAATRIMLVEDESIVAEDIRTSLESLGYIVSAVVASGVEALDKAAELRPDLALMDIILQGAMNGIEAAELLRERFDIPVVYLTAHTDSATLQRAKHTAPFGYIVKPFEERQLATTIEMAVYKHATDRKLQESERLLATTLHSIGEAVITTDTTGRVTMLNPAAEQLTGWAQADAMGLPATTILPIVQEGLLALPDHPVTQALRQGEVVRSAADTLLSIADGSTVPIAVSAAPMRYGQHNPAGVVVVCQDLTARKRLEAQVEQSLEELNSSRVEAFIKAQYTAIHPTVEWRFRQVARQRLQPQGSAVEIEPIVFHDVYPLYAVSDIRGASTRRNEAIQADLLTQLRLAEAVVQQAATCRSLPVLDELTYRLYNAIKQVEASLNAGDEEAMLDFLRRDVEVVFDHLQGFAPSVHERIQTYWQAIHPRLGVVYQQRRDFEESVIHINETIAAYLNAEEAIAQQMFPHYFETHTSDGVEHGIYVGASLVEDGKFDVLYLHNIRLWQLLVMCGSAQLTAQLRPSLAMPLETTHLVLAHHAPLSIRFHPEEKQFEVDGAYNLRYEIIKKGIDKTVLKGTAERLTQPGKIAIVYSHPREAEEYRQYLEYLSDRRYVSAEVEDVDLEDVQGFHGLKALRVTVHMQQFPLSLHAQ